MKNRKLGNDGFSLVELIIVITIMAVLAAVLAPQLIKYIEKSKANVCQHNMGTIDEAIQLEITDKRESYINYGKITDLSTVELYDGTQCPSGGTYDVEVFKLLNGEFKIKIECSKHGEYNGN